MSANKPVDVKLSFKAFLERGRLHRDGWGVAWYLNGAWGILKEPVSAVKSDLANYASTILKGKTFIGHVRYATVGSEAVVNTHPFIAKLYNREFVFAHKGQVSNIFSEFKLVHMKPLGETDSELAFMIILERLMENNPRDLLDEAFFLYEIAERLSDLGFLNFVLSDGERFYAFSDGDLSYVVREAPFARKILLLDNGLEVNLSEVKTPEEKVTMISSKPLTVGERWEKLMRGTLLVVQDGYPVLTYRGSYDSLGLFLDRDEITILYLASKKPKGTELGKIIDRMDKRKALKKVKRLIKLGFLLVHPSDKKKSLIERKVKTRTIIDRYVNEYLDALLGPEPGTW